MNTLRLLFAICLASLVTAPSPAQRNRAWLQVDILREGVPASLTRVHVSTQNIEKVQCALYRITPEQFLQYVTDSRFYEGYVFSNETAHTRRALREPEGELVQQWESTLTTRSRSASAGGNVVYYSRTTFLPRVGSGIYYLRVSAGKLWRGQFVLVSRMGCIAKYTVEGLLLYTYDYEGGQPLRDVRFTLFDRSRRPFRQIRTGADGIARIPVEDARGCSALFIQRGDDALFHPLYDTAIRPPKWKLYLYTDRPIYRPGQLVHYKVVLRRIAGQEYHNAPAEELNLRLEDPRGRTLLRTKMRTNAMGSCAGAYRLNAEATIGEYTLTAEREGDESYAVFEVAAYRKPDFEVQVTPEQPLYIGEGKGAFRVKASYYFGAPVAGGKVHYTIQARPHFPWRSAPADEEEPAPLYPNLYPSYLYNYSPVVTEGEATTDAQGQARIEFDLKPTARNDTLYVAQVSVEDVGGRSVQAQGTVLGARADFALSAEIEPYFVTRNQRFNLLVQAQDYSGRPIATPFRVDLIRTWWDISARQRKEEVLHTWQGNTDPAGKATLELSWGQAGFYRLRLSATDSAGRVTETETYLSIWGREYRYLTLWQQPAALQLMFDKSSYRPGETARVMVLASRTPTIVWLTLETDRVLWSKQVKIEEESGAVVKIPVLPQYRPGVYLCAVALKGYYAPVAVRYLRIPYPEKQLQIHLQSERHQYLPGDRVRYRVKTTDGNGKPVSADLSLGVVDAAIYGLRPDTTPDPFRAFWGKRPHGVFTRQFLPEVVPGGAFQQVALAQRRFALAQQVQIRRRFEDTAYWNAFVTTDTNGEAQVEFELPDNLTRWVTTARAFTAETHAGQGNQQFTVSKPVMVRLYTPRFLVEGDKLRFQVMLTNRTGSARRMRLHLFAQPVGSLQTEVSEEQTIELQDGEQKRIDWQPFPAIPLAQRLRLTAAAVAEGIDDPRAGSDGVEQSLLVLPRATMRRDVWSGTWQNKAVVKVRLPEGAIPQAGEVVLRLYNSPVARALPALSDLVFYPYGCTEQTSSTLLGMAFARQIARQAKLNVAETPWLKGSQEKIDAGLTRLYDLQLSDGGWAWWEGEDYPLPELTAYALLALAELKAVGVNVDANVLKRAIASARAMRTKGVVSERYNPDIEEYETVERKLYPEEEAWLAYALARHGELPEPAVDWLWKQRSKLSNLSLVLLGLALDTQGGTENSNRVRELMGMLARRVKRDDTGSYWTTDERDWYTSDAECTALALRLLLRREPRHPLVASALQWLLTRREREWISTKAQAYLLGAIAEYMRHYPISSGGQMVTVQVGNRPAVLRIPSLDSEEPFAEYRLSSLELEGTEWQVQLALAAPYDVQLAYTLEVRSYLPLQPDGSEQYAAPKDLHITRRYFVLKQTPPKQPDESRWEPLNRPVRVGETVMVEVEVRTRGEREYLLVEDPYPAGFEYAPPPPRGIPAEFWEDYAYGYAEHHEPLDQHVAVFVSWMHDRYRYHYYLRAETPGERTALPPRVEMMYRPEVKAYGKAQSIMVVSGE